MDIRQTQSPKVEEPNLSIDEGASNALSYVSDHAHLTHEKCRQLNEESDTKTPGERFILSSGRSATVISYRGCYEIVIEMTGSGQRAVTESSHLRKGKVRDRYARSVHGVGYIGQGDMSAKDGSYETWVSLLNRCYSVSYQRKRPSNVDATVCDAWHDLKTFQQWYSKQPNSCLQGFEVDKDSRRMNDCEGPDQYNSDTCEIVPSSVNKLITDTDSAHGALPKGVTRIGQRFRARVRDPMLRTNKHLGYYGTVEEAHAAYCRGKSEIVKRVALEHGAMGHVSGVIVSNLIVEADRLLQEADEIDSQPL